MNDIEIGEEKGQRRKIIGIILDAEIREFKYRVSNPFDSSSDSFHLVISR